MLTETFIRPKFKKILNIKQVQEHPFHVIYSSKLPFIISSLVGVTALLLILKLHYNNTNFINSSCILQVIVDPLYRVGSLNYFSINVLIIFFLINLCLAL